jgi:hypothetical protein
MMTTILYYNPMEVILQQLLDSEVIGDHGENLATDPEVLMCNGERVIKDFHTIKHQWGIPCRI